jgi:hypothetical protein
MIRTGHFQIQPVKDLQSFLAFLPLRGMKAFKIPCTIVNKTIKANLIVRQLWFVMI